jgi:hypothetical protein
MTAVDRLEAFLVELDRMSLADLEVLALPSPDPDARAALLDRVDEAARDVGGTRSAEIRAARARIRELLFTRFAQGALDVTWAGVTWRGTGNRTDERIKLIIAVEDAAVAAMMADRLDADDIAALREPFEIASSMRGTGRTGVPDLSGSAGTAGPLVAIGLFSGAGGLGIVAAIGAFIRRRRRRLEQID